MSFASGLGRWLGCAEVYAGDGRFLGNAIDQRNVQDLGDGRTRIDLAFIGPIKAAGHYFIQTHENHRDYLGPLNVGYAETLGTHTVDANAYWSSMGLNQRLFLHVMPDHNLQLSLALMSRGDQLMYVIVGENQRVDAQAAATTPLPNLIGGTEHDLRDDPRAGRDCLLLHRSGSWQGELVTFDADRNPLGSHTYSEQNSATPTGLSSTLTGCAFAAGEHAIALRSNGWQAWSEPGDVAGSYNLSGGRALSGQFIFQASHTRLWRREVASGDGSCKAVLHTWYRGGQRIGAAVGVLRYAP